MRKLFALLLLTLLTQPLAARASGADLAISASSITFSTDTFYVDDTVRIYTSIRNVGDVDTTAYVSFYVSSMVIGRSQIVSLRANGAPDEVFVDFTVPEGSFNIRAVIQGTSPQDVNPSNDSALTPLYTTIADADRDGVENAADNCVTDANTDQANADSDDLGDVCDARDDRVPAVTQPEAAPEITPPQPAVAQSTSASSPTPVVSVAPPAPSSVTSTPAVESATEVSTKVTSATSLLKTSPYARFTYRQIDWRTYEFTLAEQPESGVQFSWDFGDGASSVQSQITHAFAGPGVYTVTLAIVDEDGNMASDAAAIDVSFFNLDNPVLQLTLGLLFVLLAGLAVVLVKLRKR